MERVSEERVESGKAKPQAGLMKALSRQTRVGVVCWFDQVNLRSRRGSSISCSVFRQSLNMAPSAWLKFELDRSAGSRDRLKSPIKATGPERGETADTRESRKRHLDPWVQGP